MDPIDTATRPLDALCNDIVVRYHAPLRRRLTRIRGRFSRLTAASDRVASLLQVLADLADRLESHLAKEELLLFPAIAALAVAEREHRGRPRSPFVTVLHPIRMLEAEHSSIEADVERLRQLALEVTAPPAVTPAWRQCVTDLAEFDAALRDHHRNENEVLFPAALEAERRQLWLGYDGARDRAG